MPEPSSMDGFMRLPEGGAEEGRGPHTRTASAHPHSEFGKRKRPRVYTREKEGFK